MRPSREHPAPPEPAVPEARAPLTRTRGRGAQRLRMAAALGAGAWLACAAPAAARQEDVPITEAQAQDSPDLASATAAEPLLLSSCGPDERAALNRLATCSGWPSRAIAVMRLERFDCEQSRGLLDGFVRDPAWQVRAYAYACLARRGLPGPAEAIASETEPRVLRSILRSRNRIDRAELDARIARLEKSARPLEAMVALETLAALDAAEDPSVARRMDELLERIVLRMDRTEAGILSNRLSQITSGADSGRDYRWREWWRKNKQKPGYRPGALVPSAPAGERLDGPNRVAALDSAAFVSFDKYLSETADRPMDLAILIDCTASMGREIAAAQGGIDDLMNFLGSVTKGVRVAIVGYRDRGGDWETKAWDFTSSLEAARERLWSLSADGGGDAPESVYAAMKLALTQCSWIKDPPSGSPPIRACVLVGDAPPHSGEGTHCVNLARRGLEAGVRFYGIVARDDESGMPDERGEAKSEARESPGSDPASAAPGLGSPPAEEMPPPAGKRPAGNPDGVIDPPKPPPPVKATQPAKGRGDAEQDAKARKAKPARSKTWFPEIAAAGGGRAEILRDQDQLAAEIAQLAIADRYREEFADFFAAFRLLCR